MSKINKQVIVVIMMNKKIAYIEVLWIQLEIKQDRINMKYSKVRMCAIYASTPLTNVYQKYLNSN